MYYLRSMAYGAVFTALATGIRVRSCDLRWNKLAELFYPIPPRKEQDAIVAHIDEKLKKIAEAIDDKKRQLATLEEYKKSLIFSMSLARRRFQREFLH
jgi:type I restriction enzyme S subunit